MLSGKVDVDVVEEIARTSKSILANPIMTVNKRKRQLRPLAYAQWSASNFIAFGIANETQPAFL